LFCGILDVHTGNIDFCNAGHNFPFLIKNDQTVMEIRNQHGPPAGLVEDQNYKSDSLSIEPGEVLVLYTDGVTEARNENDELYGEERLRDSILEVKDQSLSPRDICEHVLNKNKKFNGDTPQDDDITVLCLRKG
jgi:sigma-B regulation protein RsbU (phosphoserine phosphatase)